MNTTGAPLRFGMWSPRDEQAFARIDQKIAQAKDLASKPPAYLVDQLDKLDSPQPDSVDTFVKDLAPTDDERRLSLETELMFHIGRSADTAELETTKKAIGDAPHYQPSPLMGKLVGIIKSILEMPASHLLPNNPTDADKQKIAVTSEMVMGLAERFAQKQMAGDLGPLAQLFGKGGLGGPGKKMILLNPKAAGGGLPPQQDGPDFDLPPQGGQGGDDILDLLDDTKGPKK